MILKDWTRCAADYQNTLARPARRWRRGRASTWRRRLGLCQARAGKLADAERHAGRGRCEWRRQRRGVMWPGEVRIAMGKLERGDHRARIGDRDGRRLAGTRALAVAGAYDRARKPSEATKVGAEALKSDRELSTLKPSAAVPLLGTGESEYLMGPAYGVF
jgi:hypothetical protein